MRLAMMIDLRRCVGCLACVSACKERWDSGPGAARDWVRTYERGKRGSDLSIAFYPGLCMQCEEHPCTLDCPTGATWRNDKGVVTVDPDVCIGCGNCVSACPYGARHVDPVKGIVEKCNLCEPYVARGETPACVGTCLAECRHFGDLDDPEGLARLVREAGAAPLVAPGVDVRPKVTYAGDAERAQLLAAGVVQPPRRSLLTRVWEDATRPFVRIGIPGISLGIVAAGLAVDFLGRKERLQREASTARAPAPSSDALGGEASACAASAAPTLGSGPVPRPSGAPAAGAPGAGSAVPVRTASGDTAPAPPSGDASASWQPKRKLPRHRAGMRFLHWFNALSWVLLLFSGTALMSARSFALFGESFPRWAASAFGGASSLLRFHALWGLLWAAVIVPLFLLYKRGGREALEEIRLRRDDLRWLALKPLAMIGRLRGPLPAQDKYNGGQKLYAMAILLSTFGIIATGTVMTFHLGPAWLVAASILVHKLAIALTLLGLAVHVTMAALLREERPALVSMFTGEVDRDHAVAHSARWVEALERQEREALEASQARRKDP